MYAVVYSVADGVGLFYVRGISSFSVGPYGVFPLSPNPM